MGSKSKEINSRDAGKHATSSLTWKRQCTEPELANPPNKLWSGWAHRSSAAKTQGSKAAVHDRCCLPGILKPCGGHVFYAPLLNSSPQGRNASISCLFPTVTESPSAVPPASTSPLSKKKTSVMRRLRHVHTWVLQGLYCHWFGHHLRKCNRPKVATAQTRRLKRLVTAVTTMSQRLPIIPDLEPEHARFSTAVVVCQQQRAKISDKRPLAHDDRKSKRRAALSMSPQVQTPAKRLWHGCRTDLAKRGKALVAVDPQLRAFLRQAVSHTALQLAHELSESTGDCCSA